MAQGPSGWVRFASIVLIFAGIMRVLDSIWAFRFKGSLPVNLNGGTLGSDLATYAVVYLVVGALLIASPLIAFTVLALPSANSAMNACVSNGKSSLRSRSGGRLIWNTLRR